MTTVLIIDDDAEARADIRGLIPPTWTLLEANDGLGGLDVIRQRYNDLDLVLLDMNLPTIAMEGRRVYLLARSIAPRLRIVPFTGYPISVEVLDELGCLPPIYKPIDRAKIYAQLEDALQQPVPKRRSDRMSDLALELCQDEEQLRRLQRSPLGAVLYRITDVLRSGLVQHLSPVVRVTEVGTSAALRLALETPRWTAIVTEVGQAPEIAALAQAHGLPLLCIAFEPSQLRATQPAPVSTTLLANDPALSERLRIALNAIALGEPVPCFPPPLLPGTSPRQALPPALLRHFEALGLSAREFDVVGLSAQDLTHDDIAQRLEITAATVNSHWRNIAAKLGVSPRQAQDWLREEISRLRAFD